MTTLRASVALQSAYGSPYRQPVRLPRSGRHLPRYAGQCADRAENADRIRPKISGAVDAKPPGLLLHESLIYSLFPPHIGMRQYWRDFESLERWSRSEPHQEWWRGFLRDSGGTGFWHEAYFMRGGMEAVYVDMPVDLGFSSFAPHVPARGSMFSARQRAGRAGTPSMASPLPEAELYQDGSRAEDRQ